MTTLPIYGGPTKRELIVQARAECGQRDSNYQIEPEEYDEDIKRLNALMGHWLYLEGIDLGYNFPTSNIGSPADESGIPFGTEMVVAAALAFRIAPTLGKTLSGETRATLALSMGQLRAQCVRVPQLAMRSTTPRGAGNERFLWRRGVFYPSCQTIDAERTPPDCDSDAV